MTSITITTATPAATGEPATEAALIAADLKFTVSIGEFVIGTIKHFPVKQGWLFISHLPSGAGRSRKGAPIDTVKQRIARRFPGATIVATAVTP
jgi:hypothetical protein